MAVPVERQIRTEWEQEERERDALITRYIKPHPSGRGRAYVYFPDYGFSVSAVIRAVQMGEGIAQVATAWNMPEDAVRAAIVFHHRHRPFIDARILIEDDEFVSDW